MKSDLITTRLTISTFAEAVSSTGASDASSFELSSQTKKLVFDLITEKLNVELNSQDIDVARESQARVHLW